MPKFGWLEMDYEGYTIHRMFDEAGVYFEVTKVTGVYFDITKIDSKHVIGSVDDLDDARYYIDVLNQVYVN